MRKTWIVMLSFIVMISLLVACGDDKKDENAEDGQDGEEMEMPEPDLEGIPEVVAEVNGDEISKDEFVTSYEQQFQQIAMQAQLSGEEVDQDEFKGQVAEGMVGQRLLVQEASDRTPDVSDEDIDETLNEIVEENGLETKEELFAAFEEQGMEEEEVMSLIEEQVKIDKLIAEEAGDIEPTDEEIEEAYSSFKAQQAQMSDEEEVPALDDVKDDLVNQVKYQKEAEATQTLVEKLQKDADVTIHL